MLSEGTTSTRTSPPSTAVGATTTTASPLINGKSIRMSITFTRALPHSVLRSVYLIADSSHDPSAQQKQRRRNSSIAKILGGQPLKNQQYEGTTNVSLRFETIDSSSSSEIKQQLNDNHSAQANATNGDNTTDTPPIQRSRSSITRNLLMNAGKTPFLIRHPSTSSSVCQTGTCIINCQWPQQNDLRRRHTRKTSNI